MGILNRWRQFGKRYFWPHLLLGVVAASIGAPSILANTGQQTLSATTATSVNRFNNSIQSISDNSLWAGVSRQPIESINPWHQQAIRRFLTRLAFVIVPQNQDVFASDNSRFHELSLYEWSIVDSLTALLASTHITIPHQYAAVFVDEDRLAGQRAGLWLVQQGGLRAGPVSYR